MKITAAYAYNAYNTKRQTSKSTDGNSDVRKESPIKQDTVTISKESVQGMKIHKVATDITEQVLGEDSADKIDKLKSLIENNQYDLSNGAIADAMLDRFYHYKKEVN